MNLPPSHLAVLEAMTRPDPRPPRDFDNPAEAIARRLPGTPLEEVVRAIRAMNALGLTQVPYVLGTVTARVTQDPRDWITDEGWKAMGMDRETDAN